MSTSANNYAVSCLARVLDSAVSDDLIVERRTWDTLLKLPKEAAGPRTERRKLSADWIVDCTLALADDEEEQIVVITVGDGSDVPKYYVTIAADQDSLIGVFDQGADTPLPDELELEGDAMARGRPYLIPIVQQILADGKPRTAEEILEIGIAKGLLPKTTLRKNLYGHLIQYIERTKAHGRKPLIIQNPTDRTFSINQPPDDWPDIPIPEPPEPSPQVKQVIDRLTATSTGTNPTDFELAVCEAFEQLGYIAKHIGGEMNPDGIIDAPLGPKAYRSIVECKTSVKGSSQAPNS